MYAYVLTTGSVQIKKKFLKVVVCGVMLMRNSDPVDVEEKRKLETIEMWKTLKVEWTLTNGVVLEGVKEKREL